MQIPGSFHTEIGLTDDGFVSIKQADHGEVQLSAAQLEYLIEELQELYETRMEWETRGVRSSRRQPLRAVASGASNKRIG